VLEVYRPEHFDQVKAFARRQSNFGYVKEIIKAHSEQGYPGGCWVWRVRGPVVAFCGMLYLNPDDAWLYGMRVDDRFKGKGVATRFTRGLFRIARAAGRTWAGLNTLDHRKPAPVFRIAEKLDMKLESIHATDPFWRLPRRFNPPRLRRMKGIFDHYVALGQKTIFHERPGWLWSRLIPARKRWVNQSGFRLQGLPDQQTGLPIHVVRHPIERNGKNWFRLVSVNLFDRSADSRQLLESLLGYAGGKHRGLVINYPAEWKHELRRAARELVPTLKRGRNCWFTTWRIYGKELKEG